MMLWAQQRQPLVPSKRNDRRMAEQAAQQAAQQQSAQTPENVETIPAESAMADSAIWAPVQVQQLGADNYEPPRAVST